MPKVEREKPAKSAPTATPYDRPGAAASAVAGPAANTAPATETKEFILHPELQKALEGYRKERAFDADKWIAAKVTKFNEYMSRCRLKAAVVSLSGGVDSAVTLGLLKAAKEAKDSTIERFMGIAQPIQSSAWALNRARECAEKMGAELICVDQTSVYHDLLKVVEGALPIKAGSFAAGQLRSYMRTPVGYFVCQLLSQEGTPAVVMGTGNMDEDGYLAYFCKAGDGVVDIQLISDLHKSEVFQVGAKLGVPASILDAKPSADLWDGQTDEEELGFSYDFVELFTGYFLKLSPADQAAFKKGLGAAALSQFEEAAQKAEKVHRANAHKLAGPVNL